LILLAASSAQKTAPPKAETLDENAVQAIERFDNKQMAVAVKGGKPAVVHVAIHDWLIQGKQKIEKFPAQGQLLVQLHSGKITTVISGKEEKHLPGDFWVVPAGASMSVQVTSESAALHVVALGKP
jgi:quercetin dioxygenase-like cupin family protein